MDEEEDDFYGGGGQDDERKYAVEYLNINQDNVDMSDGQGEDEDDESDDDVQFTLERPEGARSESAPTTRATRQPSASQDRKVSAEAKTARAGTPLIKEEPRGSLQPAAVRGTLTHDGKEGKDFPEVRNSKVDVNGTPIWPVNGKPITQVDMDADLAENSQIWRLPGTDLTDFFNYGFDEYTWIQYCMRQNSMAEGIAEGKQNDAQMKMFFEGGGNNAPGGLSGMPPGMGPPGGMPPLPANPQDLMQQMIAQGYDPMDQNQFMQFVASQGGGFGGGNQNSASPHPHAGGGFQAPQGPGGEQGGFGGNMDGYSPQQLAIMQGTQGQQGGRGRGRGRGRW